MASTKLELPSDIAEVIRRHVASVREDWAQDPLRMGEIAARIGMLPLMSDFGGFCGISPEGNFVAVMWDSPEEPQEIKSARTRDIALHLGCARYPVLASLLPRRPEDARLCPECGGSGRHPLAVTANAANVLCWCGGLGWIPESWNDEVQ